MTTIDDEEEDDDEPSRKISVAVGIVNKADVPQNDVLRDHRRLTSKSFGETFVSLLSLRLR